jgi:hypothetical protein
MGCNCGQRRKYPVVTSVNANTVTPSPEQSVANAIANANTDTPGNKRGSAPK